MKIIYAVVMLLFLGNNFCSAQEDALDTPTFTISVTTFNHAEEGWFGAWTYTLKDSLLTLTTPPPLTVKGGNRWPQADEVHYTGILTADQIASIKVVHLDDLEEHYDNACVMLISGSEYFVTYFQKKEKRTIWLHHYYHSRISTLITALNSCLPEKFRINYVGEDTKQDCSY